MTDREPYLALRNFKVWFSRHRGFVEALRRLDGPRIEALFGGEPPRLSPSVRAQLRARRDELLAAIERKVGDAGSDETLAFP